MYTLLCVQLSCVTVESETDKSVIVLPLALPLLLSHCRAEYVKQFFADLEHKLICEAAKKAFKCKKAVLADKPCVFEQCYLALKGVCDAGACKVSDCCISNCQSRNFQLCKRYNCNCQQCNCE
jgi:hypothetical protein